MTCKLCNKNKFKLIYDLGDYKIEQCDNCGLVRTRGQMQVSYDEYHRDTEYSQMDDYFRNIFMKRFNLINRYKNKSGRVLDIGASTGNLLKIFEQNGWESWGVEPSEIASQKHKNLKILHTTFEKAKLPKTYFDVVIMNHTFEHVDDPLLVLKKIKNSLRKGGIVYIDVPNFDSLSRKIAGKNWKYLHPYEHVHQFTPESLAKCMREAGFSVKWTKTWSGIFDVANPVLKFWQTLTSGKKQFFTDMIEIPGNVFSTALNQGTSLAMLGEKDV